MGGKTRIVGQRQNSAERPLVARYVNGWSIQRSVPYKISASEVKCGERQVKFDESTRTTDFRGGEPHVDQPYQSLLGVMESNVAALSMSVLIHGHTSVSTRSAVDPTHSATCWVKHIRLESANRSSISGEKSLTP